MVDDIDIAADAGMSMGGEGAKENLDRLLAEYAKVSALADAKEAELKTLNERVTKLETELLPLAMENCRMKNYVAEDGSKVSVKDFMNAGVPTLAQIEKEKDEDKKAELQQRRANGFEWLRNNGGAAVIANEVTIDAKPGKDNQIGQIIGLARELELAVEQQQTVNANTLISFLKEKRKLGTNLPVDLFKIFEGKKVTIKKAKEKL